MSRYVSRPGSLPRLPVVDEEVASGAVRDYRERRPPISLPPPPEFVSPLRAPPMPQPQPQPMLAPEVEDADDRPSVVEFGKAVHVQHGKLRIVIPWVVVGALITAVGSYYGMHSAEQNTPKNDEVVSQLRAMKDAADAKAIKDDTAQQLLIQRVGTLETNFSNQTVQLGELTRHSSDQQGQLTAILMAVRAQK